MTADTPAARLAKAAEKLRGLASAATPGPWEATVDPQSGGKVDVAVWADSIGYYVAEQVGSTSEPRPADAQYIAAMHPGVALLLADLLDQLSAINADVERAAQAVGVSMADVFPPDRDRALALADALLEDR